MQRATSRRIENRLIKCPTTSYQKISNVSCGVSGASSNLQMTFYYLYVSTKNQYAVKRLEYSLNLLKCCSGAIQHLSLCFFFSVQYHYLLTKNRLHVHHSFNILQSTLLRCTPHFFNLATNRI